MGVVFFFKDSEYIYICFGFKVLGFGEGCFWILFFLLFWGKGVGVVVRLHNQISIIIFYS
jgi:hypothetical protein